MIEIYPQATAAGDAPGDIHLEGGRGIDAAGFPKFFECDSWDRARVKDHHLALPADAGWFIFDEKDVGRRIGEGIADQLVEGGVHGF
jgi:hypothetical protein